MFLAHMASSDECTGSKTHKKSGEGRPHGRPIGYFFLFIFFSFRIFRGESWRRQFKSLPKNDRSLRIGPILRPGAPH